MLFPFQFAQSLTQPPVKLEQVTVFSIIDGDTIWVTDSTGTKKKIRFEAVDAPEKLQAWGKESKENLAKLIPPKTVVKLCSNRVPDQYQRTIAEVFDSNGQLINLLQVKSGNAVVYSQYLKSCSGQKQNYLDAEDYAKANRLNFWSQSNPELPSEFRRRVQSLRLTKVSK